MAFYVRLDKLGFNEMNKVKKLFYGDTASPGDKQVRIVLEDGDYVLKIYDTSTWKIVEKTRSQERTYHGQAAIDENNPIYIPFNVFASATSVKLKLWGVNFPSYHYTELPAHDHGAHAFASTAHVHTVASHVHSVSISVWSDAQSATHRHNYGGTNPSELTGNENANHAHAVNWNGNTGGATPATGVPSATDTIPSQGIGGYTLNDTAKVLVDTLIQLYITAVQGTWGTAKDKDTTTPVDFSTLVNINANGGTDEFDIFPHVTAGSFNYIKIAEPTAKKGGTILWHLSVS